MNTKKKPSGKNKFASIDPEKKYRQLIENSLQGIVIIQDLKIVYSNESFAKITGYSTEELLSFEPEQVMNLVHPDDRKIVWDNFRKRMAGFAIEPHYQFRGLKKDGEVRTLDLYVNKIDYEGKLAIQGLILDITDQMTAQDSLKERTSFIETILNNLPIGIAVNEIDTGKLTFINKEFQEISGWRKDEIPDLKKFFKKSLNDPGQRKNVSSKIKSDIKDKKPEDLFWDSIEIESKKGDKKFISTKTIPLYDQNLTILTVQDTTERIKAEMELQGSLKEKEILLREIHHRVKNNLQTISSLLDLQAESITDPKSREAFRSSQGRIRSMALIHERLYKSENLSRIKARDYISNIMEYLETTYDSRSGNVLLETSVQDIFLSLDVAIPCGLIINELVSNSMKYAFTNASSGRISVSLIFDTLNHLVLSVEDNGSGIPPDISIENSKSLGLQLVNLLVKQINGKININNAGGASIKISFPKSVGIDQVGNT